MTNGKVILVGAGPGNAGLLTLRGKEAIESADVVLCDRLVGPEILAMIPDSAITINVGKSAGRHPIPQNEINELLLRYAREGKRVVRLKGGDPYLFGRGAEEIEAVVNEDIPFEVVPGVTSAIAVPAFAGIPVSHRDFASSVHIVSAHRKGGLEPKIDYGSLVKLNGTLIFLMGLEMIEALTAGLTRAGMAADTPAALVENGTRASARKAVSSVGEIAARARRDAFKSPSVLLVGGVCSLSEKLDWFSRLPLHGLNIVVTRPKGESLLSRRLRGLGANVLDFPCIRTEPLPVPDQVFASLPRYGWIIFTSPTGAELFFEALKTRELDIRLLHGARFAAVGAKTAAAVTSKGIGVEFVPEHYSAKALANGLPEDERRALIFRAEEGTPELAAALKARGFELDDVAAYRTIRESDCPKGMREALERGDVDFVTFTSASTVQGFTGSLPELDCSVLTAVCIGEETAAQARRRGFSVLVSEAATIESMIECIIGGVDKRGCVATT